MENNDYAVDAALRDVRAARETAAARLVTPGWYHPCLGVIMAVLVAVAALGRDATTVAVLVMAAVASAVALVGTYRKRYGVWVGPAQAGPRSRPAWVAYSIAVAALLLAAAAVRGFDLSPWLGWSCAVLMFVVVGVGGPVIDRRLRDDIRAGDVDLPS